jgi:hypothetical protein
MDSGDSRKTLAVTIHHNIDLDIDIVHKMVRFLESLLAGSRLFVLAPVEAEGIPHTGTLSIMCASHHVVTFVTSERRNKWYSYVGVVCIFLGGAVISIKAKTALPRFFVWPTLCHGG